MELEYSCPGCGETLNGSFGDDVDKMNEAMPELYSPNGEFKKLTKSDLLNK